MLTLPHSKVTSLPPEDAEGAQKLQKAQEAGEGLGLWTEHCVATTYSAVEESLVVEIHFKAFVLPLLLQPDLPCKTVIWLCQGENP